MSAPVIYSTNVMLKYLIQEKFQNDVHYVWSSEYFDSNKRPAYSSGALVPPSSNPADIYRDLKNAVERGDSHNAKIIEQKAVLVRLATKWAQDGKISQAEKDEIIYWVTTARFDLWKPLLYVIPREPIELQIQIVPPDKRASFGNEYIISDLERSKFDIIEL